jgi:predicted lipoprotein with Yx(FWY)xxD motif
MKKVIITLVALGLSLSVQAANVGVEEAVNIPCGLLGTVSKLQIDDRTLLTDINSISLYTFDEDSVGETACFGGCLNVWPPLIVENIDLVSAPFGVIERPDDGRMQLTINGLPLYYFFQDREPGDLNGEYPTWRPVPVK